MNMPSFTNLRFEGVFQGMRFYEVLAAGRPPAGTSNTLRAIWIRCVDSEVEDTSVLQNCWTDLWRWMQSASGRSLRTDPELHILQAPWKRDELHDIAMGRVYYSGGTPGYVGNWLDSKYPEWAWGLPAANITGDTWNFWVDGAGFFGGGWRPQPGIGVAMNGEASVVQYYHLNSRDPHPRGISPIIRHLLEREGRRPEDMPFLLNWLGNLGTAQGSIVHEIGHAAFSMPHTEGPPNVMNAPGDFRIDALIGAAFMDEDIARVVGSPYDLSSRPQTMRQQPVPLTTMYWGFSQITGESPHFAPSPMLYRTLRQLPFF